MPKGPNGEKRPADAVGLAVLIGRIATGEVEDVAPDDGKDKAAQAMGRKGGAARASSMTPERPCLCRHRLARPQPHPWRSCRSTLQAQPHRLGASLRSDLLAWQSPYAYRLAYRKSGRWAIPLSTPPNFKLRHYRRALHPGTRSPAAFPSPLRGAPPLPLRGSFFERFLRCRVRLRVLRAHG